MAFSKITLDGVTLMDVTQDTVTAANLLDGITATGADGSGVIGSIASNSAADVVVAGPTVSIPSGYYSSAVSKTLASATLAAPTVQLLQNLGAVKVTATVDSAWYAAQSSSVVHYLTTQAAATYTPSSATQTIPSGVYLTGVQTIEPIPIAVDNHRLIVPEGYIGV